MSTIGDSRSFPIRLDPRFRLPLLLYGVVGSRNAYARLKDGRVEVRFGFFSLTTPLANIERWEISGPYKWWRAIGVRGEWGKPEITFGGSPHGGIAVVLRRPIERWWWVRQLREAYLTLADLTGFAAELERHGIAGSDARAPGSRG